jgi:glycerophosphoryl diester phosphodiesterase
MIIIGHRGVAGRFPENTFSSINAAIELGLEWIEVDIQPTKDGILVVCHDHTVNRCSNGKGRVDELTLEELRKLNFAHRFNSSMPPQTIMTLNELLCLADDRGIKLNLEVKVDKHDAHSVCQLLSKELLKLNVSTENILLSSFDHQVIRELHQQLPQFPLAVLTERLRKKDRALLKEVSAVGCNLNHVWTNQSQVESLKADGYQVWCYTVNNPNRLKHLKNLDGLFSDFPERFL